MEFMKIIKNLIGTSLIFFGTSLNAAIIDTTDNSLSNFYQLNHFEPLGQNFIAEDENITIEVEYQDMNTLFSAGDEWIMSLYDGNDGSGSLLGTQSLTSLESWATGDLLLFDFSFVELTTSTSYSFALSTDGVSAYGGIQLVTANNYSGGDYFHNGDPILFPGNYDLSFRITPVDGTSQVPEPSILALFGAGIVGLGFARRRRTQS